MMFTVLLTSVLDRGSYGTDLTGEVRFAGLRIPTVQPYKNIHILFDLYLRFSRKLNIKEGILLLNLETGK